MQLLKNKKGFACIDAIPAILALIMALAAFVDIFIILRKTNVISTTATYVARTIGPQGGVKKQTPNYYKGCTKSDGGPNATSCKYTNLAQLYSNVKDMLSAVGLDEDNFTLTITARDKTSGKATTINVKEAVGSGLQGIQTDYGNYLSVDLTINYQWEYISTLIGVKPVYNKNSYRNVLSTFKTRE